MSNLNEEKGLGSTFIGILMWLIFFVLVWDTIIEAFTISGIFVFILIIVVLLISLFIRKNINKSLDKGLISEVNEKLFIVVSFSWSLSLNILVLTPIVGTVLLWSARGVNEVRKRVLYLVAIYIIIALIFSMVEYFRIKGTKEKYEKRFKDKAVNYIKKTIKEELINKIPQLAISDSDLEIYLRLYKYETTENLMGWYTNEEFSIKSKELIEKLSILEQVKKNEAKLVDTVFDCRTSRLNVINDIFDKYNPNTPISICNGILKGVSGEEKVNDILKSLKIEYHDNFNFSPSLDGESVEIDFITVLQGKIYTIEVKDYFADMIVLENSGQFIRKKGGITDNLNTLKQILRHNQSLRMVVDSSINIVNIIVLSDNRTKVLDNFRNENIKVVYVDALPFMIGEKQSHEDKRILLELNNYKTEAKKFKFFDIYNTLDELDDIIIKEHIKKNISIDDMLTEQNLNKINEEIKKFIFDKLEELEGYQHNKKQINLINEEIASCTLKWYFDLLTNFKEEKDIIQGINQVFELITSSGITVSARI